MYPEIDLNFVKYVNKDLVEILDVDKNQKLSYDVILSIFGW